MINRFKAHLSNLALTLGDLSYAAAKSLRNDPVPSRVDIEHDLESNVRSDSRNTRNTTIEQDLTDRSWTEDSPSI